MCENVELVCIGVVLACVAVVDLRKRIIPNPLVGLLLAGHAVRIAVEAWCGDAAGLVAESFSGMALMVVALGAAALVGKMLRLEDGIGGGDIKLLWALGFCLGPLRAMAITFVACLTGLGLARLPAMQDGPPGTFPFAPSIMVAFAIVVPVAKLMLNTSNGAVCL